MAGTRSAPITRTKVAVPLRRDPKKLREWQRRSKGLKSDPEKQREWKRRSKPINPVNSKRREKLHAKNFGDRADLVRSKPCTVASDSPCPTPCRGRIVSAHVKSRGAGGDRFDQAPLCWAHHDEQGVVGVPAFNRKYRIDLRAKADAIKREGDELGLP